MKLNNLSICISLLCFVWRIGWHASFGHPLDQTKMDEKAPGVYKAPDHYAPMDGIYLDIR